MSSDVHTVVVVGRWPCELKAYDEAADCAYQSAIADKCPRDPRRLIAMTESRPAKLPRRKKALVNEMPQKLKLRPKPNRVHVTRQGPPDDSEKFRSFSRLLFPPGWNHPIGTFSFL